MNEASACSFPRVCVSDVPFLLSEVGAGEREQAVALAQVARAHVRRRDLRRVGAREPARLAVAGALAVVPT